MDKTTVVCECGCGELIEIKPHHKYRGLPRFVRGHQSRMPEMKAIRKSERVTFDPPNPSGLCMCGCGEKTPIAGATKRERGILRGHPVRYVMGHQARALTGEKNHRWKGGRIMNRGYVLIYSPDHEHANSKGYVPEHQLVACQAMGRWLFPGEAVHHINGVKDDNRPENLVVLTQSQHRAEHATEHSELMKKWMADNPDHASRAGSLGAEARWNKD